MKPNELQIYDWVLDKENLKHTVVGVDLGADEDHTAVTVRVMEGAYSHGDLAHTTDVVRIIEVKPLPLTADILELSGFERTRMGIGLKIYKRDGGNIYLEEKDPNTHEWLLAIRRRFPASDRCEVEMRVHYVHELQHALRLFDFDDKIIACKEDK